MIFPRKHSTPAWRYAVKAVLLMLVSLSIFLPSSVSAATPNLPEELRAETNGKMVLLDFYSAYCGTCRMMEPHLKTLQEKTGDRIAFKHINVGEGSGKAYLKPFHITGTPMYVLYNPDGKAVYRMAGLISPTVLEKQVLRSLRRLKTVDFPEGTALPNATQKPPGELGDLLLVSFENTQCEPCKVMRPYLNGFEMAGQSGLQVVHLDTATPAGKSMMNTLNIKTLPAYILLDNTAMEIKPGKASKADETKVLSRGELFRSSGAIQPRLLWDIIRLFGQSGV